MSEKKYLESNSNYFFRVIKQLFAAQEFQDQDLLDLINEKKYEPTHVFYQLIEEKKHETTHVVHKLEKYRDHQIIIPWISEAETFDYETFDKNGKKQIKQKQVTKTNGGISFTLLGYFTYLEDFEAVELLLAVFEGKQISLEPDFLHNDPLTIALKSKNHSLISLIADNLIKNPPSYGKWPLFNCKIVKKLLRSKYQKIGALLDSRLFVIDFPLLDAQSQSIKEKIDSSKCMIVDQDSINNVKNEQENKSDCCLNCLNSCIKCLKCCINCLNCFGSQKMNYTYRNYVLDLRNVAGDCIQKSNQKTKISNDEEEKKIQIESPTSPQEKKKFKEDENEPESKKMTKKKEEKNIIGYLVKKCEYQAEKDNVYSSKVIENLISLLWKSYGNDIFLINILNTFVVLIYALFSSYVFLNIIEDRRAGANVITLLFGYAILYLMITAEATEIIMHGWEYFLSEKNYFDFFMMVFYGNYIMMLTLIIAQPDFLISNMRYLSGLLVVRSLLVLVLSARAIYIFQIFAEFGRYFRLILESIHRIFFFFLVFFCMIVTFTVGISNLFLHLDHGAWVESLDLWYEIFEAVYRLAFNELDSFDDIISLLDGNESSSRRILLYVYFYVIIIILPLTMLNILIAVLSDAYNVIKSKSAIYINYSRVRILDDIHMSYNIVEQVGGNSNSEKGCWFCRKPRSFCRKLGVYLKDFLSFSRRIRYFTNKKLSGENSLLIINQRIEIKNLESNEKHVSFQELFEQNSKKG